MPSTTFWILTTISLAVFTAGTIKKIRSMEVRETRILLYKTSQACGTTAIITGVLLFISIKMGTGYYPETIIGEVETLETLTAITLISGLYSSIGLIDWLWNGMPRIEKI